MLRFGATREWSLRICGGGAAIIAALSPVCAATLDLVADESAAEASAPAATETAGPQKASPPATPFDAAVTEAKSSMMRAPADAYEAAERSYDLAADLPEDQRVEAEATALWLKSEAALRMGEPAEGSEAAEMGLSLIDGVEGLKDLEANLTLARGRLARSSSDPTLAVTSFFRAHELFVEVGDARKEALTLQSLGTIYRDAKSYDKALDFFIRSAEVYEGDDIVRLSIQNNVGNILRDTERYDEGRVYFTNALEIAKAMQSNILIGRVLINLAELELSAGNVAEANRLTREAATELSGDDAEYWSRFVYGVRADIALKQDRLGDARGAIEMAFKGVDLETTAPAFRTLHETASHVYEATGFWQLAFAHHKRFKAHSDTSLGIAASSNLALMNAEFQFAEQKLAIERLRYEKLESAAKLEEVRDAQQRQQTIMAGGGLILLSLIGFGALVVMHQRKMRMVNAQLSGTVDQLSDEIHRRQAVEADLITAKDAAEEADRMKSVFLATMSHELRTPMNGILGFTEVLLSGELSAEQREQIEIIDQSSGSLLTLINDILDLSQLEAGKFKLRTGNFDVRVTATNAVKLLKAKALEKHLDLVVDIDPDVPASVHGDEDRLRQIILNLVGNAVKFTERGAVILRVRADDAGTGALFEIIDTGVGIPQDKINVLFDRFSQIDGTHTRKHAGSGLGLAICKELVAAMGGEIGCTSVPGEGSTFWFSAPLFGEDSKPATSPQQLPQALSVAVIDSLPPRREAVVRLLTSIGADAFIVDADVPSEDVDVVLIGGTAENSVPSAFYTMMDAATKEPKVLGFGSAHTDADEYAIQRLLQPLTRESLSRALRDVMGLAEQVSDTRSPAPSAMRSGQVANFENHAPDARVLIVDDIEANRKLVECILKQLGVECVLVENGQEAVDVANAGAFALILMDVFMPVMGGIEAARTIRSGGGVNASAPIFALTATASPEERQEAINAGMDGVLTKPLNIAELRETVSRCLRGETPELRADRPGH